jgi:signal transduction histidine kinase
VLITSLKPPFRLWLLALVAALLILTGCTAATSQATLIQSQEWLMDKTGHASLQEVTASPDWQPMARWQSWGYGPETIWIRTKLKAAAHDTRTSWIVQIKPPYLDYLTLYDPSANLVLRSGDALPPNDDSLASIYFTFQIPALQQERDIYLQLKTSSTRTLSLEVLPFGQAQLQSRLQEWLMGVFTATSGIFAVWASAQWWISRERLIGAFAFKQIIATTWAFFLLGFARIVIGPFLPESVLTTIASTSFILVISVTLWFLAKFIESYQPARWALFVCRVLAIAIASLTLLQFFDLTSQMLELGNIAILLAFSMLLITLLTAMPQKTGQPIPLKTFLIYLFLYSALSSLPPLIHLGWISAHPVVLIGTLAHAVLDGVVMFIMLQIRARTLQQEQQQTTMNLERSEQKAETEKRHREEQSQLFAMLAHELKTPLATLRMRMELGELKREVMDRTIADMNQVIERCVHTGQLADQGLEPYLQSVDPIALTQSCIQSCRYPGQVDFSAPNTSGLLHTDAQMLSIVLGNLLDNACKYGVPQSRIQVSLQFTRKQDQSGWLWHVTNQAGTAGLPDTAQLFEKYYRSPQARRVSGSGLGLFLVKGLIDLLQGTISYTAQAGHPVFTVWVPDLTMRR